MRVVLGVAALALLVRVAVAVPGVRHEMTTLATSAPAPIAVENARAKPPVSSLACFGCHNYTRYRDGSDKGHHFAHADHDGVGHCHKCHAFERHFRVTLRAAACLECHDDGLRHGE